MIRNALFASLITLAAAAGVAQAQAPDTTGRVPPSAGNAVGGGAATIAGGGDDMQITYASGGAGANGSAAPRAQPPRLARARNGTNGSMSVDYLEPETARPGREASLVGGGEDAQVVYRRPL
jgi:hypothetical protein